MISKCHLLLLVSLAIPSSASVQFLCIIGEDCKLDMYARGVPPTPSFRISDAACGATDVGSIYSITSQFLITYTMPAVLNPELSGIDLNICLALNDVADPNYTTEWGTVRLVGPAPLATPLLCYFGSTCVPVLTGTYLSSTPSIVFYSSTGTCTTVVDGTLYGLHNEPPITITPSSSSPYTFDSLGVVDPTLTVETDLTLCWAASPTLAQSTPIVIGILRLTGPTDRARLEVCYMGSDCSVSIPGELAGSSLMVSNSDECDSTSTGIVWSGTTSKPVYNAGSYVFGTPTSGTDESVLLHALCYSAKSTDPYNLVDIGDFSMVGPTGSTTIFSCIAGSDCVITLPGVFDSSQVSYVYLKSNDCSGADVSLEPPSSSLAFNPASAPVTSTGLLSAMGFPIGKIGRLEFTDPIAVCWQNHIGGDMILAGIFSVSGPANVGTIYTCWLGSSCDIDLGDVVYAGDETVVQLVEYDTATDLDPCVTGTVLVTSTPPVNGVFTIASFNRALDPGNDGHAVCWIHNTNARGVNVADFDVQGPTKISTNIDCYLGTECEVVLAGYTGGSTDRLFLVSSDIICEGANSRTTFPELVGDSNFANPTESTTETFSFGTILGGSVSFPSTFTICFSTRTSLHKSAVLGSLTVSDPFTFSQTAPPCVLGSACAITVSAAGVLSSSLLGISLTDNCDAMTYPSDYTAQSSLSGSDQDFSIPITNRAMVGTGRALCYFLVGPGGPLRIGAIAVEGVVVGDVECTRGTPTCSFPYTAQGSVVSPAIFLSQSVSDCSVSETIVTSAGSTSVSWTMSGSAISSNSGIARVVTDPTRVEFGICFQSSAVVTYLVIGVLRLIGPIEGSAGNLAFQCETGAGCDLSITGEVGETTTVPGIILVSYIDFTSDTTTNPCLTAVAVSPLSSTSFPIAANAFGAFNLGALTAAVTATQFTICWRADATDNAMVYVPAGFLTVRGAQTSPESPFRCYSTTDCVVTVPTVGYSSVSTEAVTALVNGTCGSPTAQYQRIVGAQLISTIVTASSTVAEQVFNFGPLPVTSELSGVKICWAPRGAQPYISGTPARDVPVLIGTLTVVPVTDV